MKLNCWLIFGLMATTSLLAQQVTNAPPAAIQTPPPAPATSTVTAAPSASETAGQAEAQTKSSAQKSAKKKSTPKKSAAKKPAAPKPDKAAAELKTVPLVAGPAVVVASNVNVRGQAKLKSEVVTRVTKGQQLIVIEELVNNHSAADEPSAWAKVQLPPNTPVYISSSFVDSNRTVIPKKLNVRSGPGQNYSILGFLTKGDEIKQLGAKGEWLEIEPPTNAYAFIAAQFLSQENLAAAPAVAAATPPPTEPAPTPTTVAEAPAVAPATAETPTNAPTAEPAPGTNAPAVAATAPTESDTNAPAISEEPPPKRIVQREGIVRGTFSIQAPTKFAIVSPENGKTIDYLYTTSTNLDLRRYKGLRIVVTGEEGLDERWGNTPVITIQRIQVLE